MHRVASELLRALRGGCSQISFARRLGYRGNPITDWERGERFPTAEETLRVAERAAIDVSAAFARFLPTVPLERHGHEFLLARWLDALRGSASLGDVARRAGVSRYSVGRWLSGRARPRLPQFLELLDAMTGRSPEWVASLVPIESVPSLEPRFRAAEAARTIAFELPWSEAVLRLLETEEYRRLPAHAPGFIASTLGLAIEEESRCLDALVRARAVTRIDGRYEVGTPLTVDTQGGHDALHRLKQHWCAVASTRLTHPRERDLFAYNVMSVSRADLIVIRDKLRHVFREIRSLVAASEPEEAAVLNLQLIEFDPALHTGETG